MKIKIPTTVTAEVSTLRLTIPIRFDEDMSDDFPLRQGNLWRATIDIDTGKIESWPDGVLGSVEMKVCDEGTYSLHGPDGQMLAEIQDYVPNGAIPGSYGDYVELNIDSTGTITNWPRKPDLSAFFDN